MRSILNNNAIPDLAELQVRYAPSNDLDVYTKVDLRVSTADLETERARFRVKAKKLTLKLELDGFEIAPSSRFGEPVKKNQVLIRTQKSSTQHVASSLSADAKANIDKTRTSAGAGLNATAAKNVVRDSKTEISEEKTHFRVKAITADRWIISEEDGSALDGTYLDDEALCRLKRLPGANFHKATVRLFALQKDLLFESEGMLQKITQTQSKLMNVLLAKSINRSDSYKGSVHLSTAEGEPE